MFTEQIQTNEAAAINRKLDLILEQLQDRQQQQEQVNDLLADAGHIVKDLSETAVAGLDNSGVQIDQAMVGELLIKVLRNLEHITELMDMVESFSDLSKDAEKIIHHVSMDAVEKMQVLDQKGYFVFLKEMTTVADRVVEHFSKEDIRDLANNVVNILETVKRITQPDMMEAVNNAIVIFRNVETTDIPEMGLMRVMRELNSKEAKKGLGFFITFLKNFGKHELISHPTSKN
jgi:uncharacterized protein YjgD (DUF1641 family)